MSNTIEKKNSNLEWFGYIPKHWQIMPMKFLLDKIYSGGTPTTSISDYWTDEKDGIHWVAISDISKSNGYLYETSKKITLEGLKSKNLEIIPKGTLLLSIFASLGKTTILGIDASVNQAIIGLKPNEKLHQKFLQYLLQDCERYISFFSSANTQENLNVTKIKDLTFPVPPISEQTKIADFLDHKTAQIDTIIEKKQKLLQLLDEKKKSIINEAVTGKKVWNGTSWSEPAQVKDSGIEWIGDIPEDWNVLKMKRILNLKSGSFISALDIETEGEYPVYGGNGIRGFTNKFNNEGKHVLIGRQGALCGNVKYVEGEIYVTEHALTVEPISDLNKQFIAAFLEEMNLNQYSVSAAQPGLSVERINELKIVLPPMHEQNLIDKHIFSIKQKNKEITDKLLFQIKLLKEYRQSLISEAVTGNIDISQMN